MPGADRQIAAVYAVCSKLGCQPFVGGIAFGDNQQTGGIFVDAMDNAGPRHPADPRKFAPTILGAMVQQGVITVEEVRTYRNPVRTWEMGAYTLTLNAMQQKVVDITRLSAWGWQAKTSLRTGLHRTYDFYLQHYAGSI